MTPARGVAATSSVREPGQRVGLARRQALQHLEDARALVGAVAQPRRQRLPSVHEGLVCELECATLGGIERHDEPPGDERVERAARLGLVSPEQLGLQATRPRPLGCHEARQEPPRLRALTRG